jgi:hypothetical protein
VSFVTFAWQTRGGGQIATTARRVSTDVSETKAPAGSLRQGLRYFYQLRLFCAARWLDRAAGAAATAISRTRGRVGCADEGDGRYNHQEIFHSILLFNFVDLVPQARERADALSDRTARRRNLRTMRTNQLANNKPRKRLVAGRRINKGCSRHGESRETKDTSRATLLFLVGFGSMACTIRALRFGL